MNSEVNDPLGLYRHEANKLKNYPFHLICKPAGPLCNLDCEYCFYLSKLNEYNKKGNEYFMTDATLKLFIRQYIQRQPAQAKEVNFVWQGGEPTLLGVNFFRKAVTFQKMYKRKGMEISNSFQTNGILINDEWCKFLKENNFLVGISIDGPQELHDKYRKFKNGKGSFDGAMEAVKLFHKWGVDFNTLTCVQADNANHPEEVYRFMKSIGSTYMQFIPIVEPETGDEDLRGLTPKKIEGKTAKRASYRSVGSLQWGQFMLGIFNEWIKEDIGEVFVQLFDNVLNMVYGYPAPVCIFRNCCGRAMIIEHNGDVYSCDHFVFNENLLGNIHKRDLELIINSDKQLAFGIDKTRLLADKCRRCPWYNLCFGECPSNRIKNEEKGERLNHLCEGYIHFYENTIARFEAMKRAINDGKLAVNYTEYLV